MKLRRPLRSFPGGTGWRIRGRYASTLHYRAGAGERGAAGAGAGAGERHAELMRAAAPLAALLLGLPICGATAPVNFVLMMSDDTGWGDMGCKRSSSLCVFFRSLKPEVHRQQRHGLHAAPGRLVARGLGHQVRALLRGLADLLADAGVVPDGPHAVARRKSSTLAFAAALAAQLPHSASSTSSTARSRRPRPST